MLDMLKGRLKDGIRITLFKWGKIFDPTYQIRTDALKDIDKKAEKKTVEMLDKMFSKAVEDVKSQKKENKK